MKNSSPIFGTLGLWDHIFCINYWIHPAFFGWEFKNFEGMTKSSKCCPQGKILFWISIHIPNPWKLLSSSHPAWRRASKASMAESKPSFSGSPSRRQRRRWSHCSKPGKSNRSVEEMVRYPRNPCKKIPWNWFPIRRWTGWKTGRRMVFVDQCWGSHDLESFQKSRIFGGEMFRGRGRFL